jgi:hypothetical protein
VLGVFGLSVILQNNKIDIAFISETDLTHLSHINQPDFNYLKTNHPDSTAHTGAAIIIRASLLFYLYHNIKQTI